MGISSHYLKRSTTYHLFSSNNTFKCYNVGAICHLFTAWSLSHSSDRVVLYVLIGSDWAGQVSVRWPKDEIRSSFKLVKDETRSSFRIVDSDGTNEQGIEWEAKSSLKESSQYTEYMRRPCQQIAARLSLFIKFVPLFDHWKPISAGKFILGDHIKILYLLRVHNCEDSM